MKLFEKNSPPFQYLYDQNPHYFNQKDNKKFRANMEDLMEERMDIRRKSNKCKFASEACEQFNLRKFMSGSTI